MDKVATPRSSGMASAPVSAAVQASPAAEHVTGLEIAIIGMAGRFPGARSVAEFWDLLRDGREAITQLGGETLRQQGVDNALLNDPQYVKAGGVLADVDQFDAAFFGYSPREAELLDPQQRLFLECAWEAMETAGYDAEAYDGIIGVYGGAGMNGYLINLYANAHIRESASPYELFLASDKDFLTTRVSYKLNLQGPSLDIQTACSSSLVAVHTACQSLLNGECDIALAGGVAVSKQIGYRFQEGGIYSPDGHCRAFDAQAQGTVGGNGVGIVVLKRLEDALQYGDTIDAVIKGSAVNNDGALKASYTAPRIDSQAAVIRAAQVMAEVSPETLSYIEAHGTGTSLGDPIEITALTQAFRQQTDRRSFCAIGSVKTNIGHLDAAAGVASLIKTVLALKHQQIPASLHFQRPNTRIDFEQSPFYVNTALTDWPSQGRLRRAGVSSFGIGGTNAHVILEEAPQGEGGRQKAEGRRGRAESRGADSAQTDDYWQLLILSAKTEAALETATVNLTAHLERCSEWDLANIAYTLQNGRRRFEHCRALVCQSITDAVDQLQNKGYTTQHTPESPRPIAFMFPGQGSQYPGMAQQLYKQEPVFQRAINRCAEILAGEGIALLEVLYGESGAREPGTGHRAQEATPTPHSQLPTPPSPHPPIHQTAYAQPALFAVEYSLAQLWLSWGVHPEALIGHSIGEYVAACLAGVFSLEDGLRLVSLRGRLMQQCPAGAMLSVGLSEAQVQALLPEGVVVSAMNGPELCAVSGTEAAIAALESRLAEEDIPCKRLQTSHGFHSPLMEPMLEPFRIAVQQVALKTPEVPIISNLSGTWTKPEEATDPDYWVRQARQPVNFAGGLDTLRRDMQPMLLEVGPGKVLSTLAKQAIAGRQEGPSPAKTSAGESQAPTPTALTSLPHAKSSMPDLAHLLNTVGQLWLQGVRVDWRQLHQEPRRRVRLPTYPFERQRYWVEPDNLTLVQSASESNSARANIKSDLTDWFYHPTWQRSLHSITSSVLAERHCWLLLTDSVGIGAQLAQGLEQAGQDVFQVSLGDRFAQTGYRQFTLNPKKAEDYQALWEDLQLRELLPTQVIHLWDLESMTGAMVLKDRPPTIASQWHVAAELQWLVNAITTQSAQEPCQITLVTTELYDVVGGELLHPVSAAIAGFAHVVGQEYPHLGCRLVDVQGGEGKAEGRRQKAEGIGKREQAIKNRLVEQLWRELTMPSDDAIVAYRGPHRWRQTYQASPLPGLKDDRLARHLKQGETYLVLGDLSQGLGQIWSDGLAEHWQAKLVLLNDIHAAQPSLPEGADGISLNLDITDVVQLRVAIEQAEAELGPIRGVFYSTPTTNEQLAAPLALMQASHWDYNFRHTIQGLFSLKAALQERSLDFCLVQSSLSAVIGGIGLTAYAAANSVVDAFVHQQNQQDEFPWFSVNWDACLSEDVPKPEGVGSAIAEFAMTPAEVWSATERILRMAYPGQIVVSKGDLSARIDQWIHAVPQAQAIADQPTGSTHNRPQLSTPYAAPRDDVEQTIAGIWQDLLRLEQVGIHDSFFDLGGHSLLAIQTISRLREAFPVNIEMRSLLFESPTVAGIASVIREHLPDAGELDEMAALLSEVQTLSPEEIQQQLTRQSGELAS